ncbi:MAG: ion transporter [Ekhidna sp.]|nr:ion transporter [Ekhidna sp.]
MKIIIDFLKKFVESSPFQRGIVGLIIFNSILIGLETFPIVMEKYGGIIDFIDFLILLLFTVELGLKIFIYRGSFFKDPWNIFDLFVISISIVPSAGSFTVLRALRIIRTLRLLKSIPKLRLIIESLLHAIPSIGWIVVLLGIVYYTFGVIGTNLFAADFPEYFGDLGKSLFSLFQIMTLESWSSGIARPILDSMPGAWIYFISFILIATYTTLNVFIAIVVNTMNEVSLKDLQEEEQHIKDFVQEENNKVHAKLDLILGKLDELEEEERDTVSY